MKIKLLLLPVVLQLCLQPGARAQTNVYSFNIVGYVNTLFSPGATLFGNPLLQSNDLLSTVIPQAPDGTTVSLWNSSTWQFSQTSTFSQGGWSLDLNLHPGTGALLFTPSLFTNTFVGTVLAPDGSQLTGDSSLVPPPPFGGANGVYLLASSCPLLLCPTNGQDVFQYILGRSPHDGEQFITLDSASQLYHVTTFSAGAWDNGDPVLNPAEAAFFNVGPVLFTVPEPSALALGLLGGVAAACGRRRLRA